MAVSLRWVLGDTTAEVPFDEEKLNLAYWGGGTLGGAGNVMGGVESRENQSAQEKIGHTNL